MRKLALVVVLGAAALALPGRAAAADECRGLDVCIPVAGPWVALRAAGASATVVHYRVRCPERSIAAGTDAVHADGVDVTFLGAMGSPIGPGVSTSRDVWFVATWAGRRAAVFRPFVGCVPTSGGGGRSTTAVRAPAPTITRRAKNVRLRGAAGASLACTRRERLVGIGYAVAFRTRTAPSAALLTAPRVSVARSGNSVMLRVRSAPAARVEVQLQATCARVA